MRHYSIFILFLVIILVTFASCDEDLFTQVVKIEVPEHQPGISIGADFSQSLNNVVQLRASKGIQEGGFLEFISNASVVLKRADQIVKIYDDQSTSGRPGYYLNSDPFILDPGIEYTIEIEKDGFNNASSSQVMPTNVPIDDLGYTEETLIDRDGDRSDELTITISDPASESNYYAMKAYVKFTDGRRDEIGIFNNIDPLIEEGVNQRIVFADGAINGKAVTFSFNLGTTFKDDATAEQIEVEFFNITKDKYLFERSLRIYEDSEFNPFVEPVIVHENVEGGHGLFSISHFELYTIDLD